MRDGQPYAETPEIVGSLETVLARNPKHPGANHLYIHAMEANTPEKAEAAADRLLTLMPGAGHMVHMPSHIYQRVGRYADAAASNESAVDRRRGLHHAVPRPGPLPDGLLPAQHPLPLVRGHHGGRGQLAIDAARKIASKVSDESSSELPLLASFRVVPYYALTRFGRWDEMLAEPAPADNFLFLKGTWHYARGLAFARQGPARRRGEGAGGGAPHRGRPGPRATRSSRPTRRPPSSPSPPRCWRASSRPAARTTTRRSRTSTAPCAWRTALVYTEPSEWHYPPRQALGAVLLDAGRAEEAETVYWEDLRRNRENGWALFGLAQALRPRAGTTKRRPRRRASRRPGHGPT